MTERELFKTGKHLIFVIIFECSINNPGTAAHLCGNIHLCYSITYGFETLMYYVFMYLRHLWGHKSIFDYQLLGQICEMSLEDWKNLAIKFISWIHRSTFSAVSETLQIPGRTKLSCFSFSIFFHLPSLLLHLSVLCSSCPPSLRFPSFWPLSLEQICLAFQSSRPGVI